MCTKDVSLERMYVALIKIKTLLIMDQIDKKEIDSLVNMVMEELELLNDEKTNINKDLSNIIEVLELSKKNHRRTYGG